MSRFFRSMKLHFTIFIRHFQVSSIVLESLLQLYGTLKYLSAHCFFFFWCAVDSFYCFWFSFSALINMFPEAAGKTNYSCLKDPQYTLVFPCVLCCNHINSFTSPFKSPIRDTLALCLATFISTLVF